jgi:hypothetical protein
MNKRHKFDVSLNPVRKSSTNFHVQAIIIPLHCHRIYFFQTQVVKFKKNVTMIFPAEDLIKNTGNKFLTYFLYAKGIVTESKK